MCSGCSSFILIPYVCFNIIKIVKSPADLPQTLGGLAPETQGQCLKVSLLSSNRKDLADPREASGPFLLLFSK